MCILSTLVPGRCPKPSTSMHARPPLRSASGGCGDGSRFRRVVTKASTDDDSVPGPRSEGGRSRKESEGDSKISGVRRDDEKILQSGWLYRGEQLTSLRRQLGWARIYADDPGVRSIDKARRDKKKVSNEDMDISEMEDFIDSWAMRNMDRVSDWEDIGRDRGWSVSGARMTDRVVKGRDQYLKPMFDARAWYDKLNPDEEAVNADLRLEMRVNEWESRQALKFTGLLFVIPLTVSSIVRWVLIDPGFELLQKNNPSVFALTERQMVHGAEEVREHERRLRFYAGIGKAPPLTETELQLQLRKEAVEIAEEMRSENRRKLENLVSDSVFSVVFMFVLIRDSVGRAMLFQAMSRFFDGLSDTGKAFLIISAADIVCGYHSEEGWASAVNLICEHYGWEAGEVEKGLFVSFFPIMIDTLFKLYLFTSLNRESPSTVATLKEMDRH